MNDNVCLIGFLEAYQDLVRSSGYHLEWDYKIESLVCQDVNANVVAVLDFDGSKKSWYLQD